MTMTNVTIITIIIKMTTTIIITITTDGGWNRMTPTMTQIKTITATTTIIIIIIVNNNNTIDSIRLLQLINHVMAL